jgi:hypothetical protein
VTSERSANFDFIAYGYDIMKERRNFTVSQPFD